MKKIMIVLGLIVFTGYANAFPLIGELTGQRFFKQRIQSNADSGVHCVNLSGQWKGKCQDNGKPSEEQTFELVQDGCEYLGSKDAKFPIGGIGRLGITLPQTEKSPSTVADITASLSWNSEGTAVVFDILAVAKEMGNGKAHQSYEGRGSAKLAGNKLQISYSEVGKPETALCEFDKQN